jgi:opacity protein-like surface antigen
MAKRSLIPFFVALLFVVTASASVFGQSAKSQKSTNVDSSFTDRFQWISSTTPGTHEINIAGGHSFQSTRGFWGKIPNAQLSIIALRYNRKLLLFNNRHVIEYVTELNITAHYTLNPNKFYQGGSFNGYGITPLGFQFNWGTSNIVQPFFKSSTGFMYFRNPFPDQRGTRFNFTLELGGGIEFVVGQNMSLSLGYKYHHMSNFQFGDINPGVDSNIFYSGITFF